MLTTIVNFPSQLNPIWNYSSHQHRACLWMGFIRMRPLPGRVSSAYAGEDELDAEISHLSEIEVLEVLKLISHNFFPFPTWLSNPSSSRSGGKQCWHISFSFSFLNLFLKFLGISWLLILKLLKPLNTYLLQNQLPLPTVIINYYLQIIISVTWNKEVGLGWCNRHSRPQQVACAWLKLDTFGLNLLLLNFKHRWN